MTQMQKVKCHKKLHHHDDAGCLPPTSTPFWPPRVEEMGLQPCFPKMASGNGRRQQEQPWRGGKKEEDLFLWFLPTDGDGGLPTPQRL
jgi:hypothetical protein